MNSFFALTLPDAPTFTFCWVVLVELFEKMLKPTPVKVIMIKRIIKKIRFILNEMKMLCTSLETHYILNIWQKYLKYERLRISLTKKERFDIISA